MRGALCAPQPPAFRAGAENRPVDIYTNSIISACKSVSANILLLFHAGNRRRKAGRGAPLFFIRRPCLRNIRAPRVCGPPCARPAISVRPQPRFGYASPAVVFYAGISRACGCVSVRQFSSPFSAMQMAALGPVAPRAIPPGVLRPAPVVLPFGAAPALAAKCGVLRQCCVRGAGSRASPCAPSEAGPRAAPPPASFLAARPRSGRSAFAMIEQAVWCSLCAPLSLFAAFYSRAARLHTPAASRFTPPGSRRLVPAAYPSSLRLPRPAPAPAVSLPGSSAYLLRRICGNRIFQIPHKKRRGNAPSFVVLWNQSASFAA